MAFKMKFSGFKANVSMITKGLGNLASGLSDLGGESDEDKQKRSDKKPPIKPFAPVITIVLLRNLLKSTLLASNAHSSWMTE